MKNFFVILFCLIVAVMLVLLGCKKNEPTTPTQKSTETITKTATDIYTSTITNTPTDTMTFTVTETPTFTVTETPTVTPTNTQVVKIIGMIYTYNQGTDPTYYAEIKIDNIAYEYATVTVKDLTAVTQKNVPHIGGGTYMLEIGNGAEIITGHDYQMEVIVPGGVFTANAKAPGNMNLSSDGTTLTWADYGENADVYFVNQPGYAFTYSEQDTPPGNNIVNSPETIPSSAYPEHGVTYYVNMNMRWELYPSDGAFTGATSDSEFIINIADYKMYYNP